MAEIDLNTLDKRTADRYVRMGLVDEKAWEKHLKGLPDLADKATTVESTPEDDIDDDDSED
jgi:hypothetical protein